MTSRQTKNWDEINSGFLSDGLAITLSFQKQELRALELITASSVAEEINVSVEDLNIIS